jgi:hypothetical protein
MLLDGDGAEVDWSVGYDAPPENFEAALTKMLSGEDTYRALAAAYARNPKDVPTVFRLARKWSERYDETKAAEKYKEVIALDPQGKAGSYTQEYDNITAPYTEYAEFALATSALQMSAKPDLGPVKAFLAKYPQSKLTKRPNSSPNTRPNSPTTRWSSTAGCRGSSGTRNPSTRAPSSRRKSRR